MILLNINGPINSGKSSVSNILKDILPKSEFIEVDNLLPDEEQQKLKLNFKQGIDERLKRLNYTLMKKKTSPKIDIIIFTYPMSEKNYQQWKQLEDEKTKLVCITLSPDLETCLTNRGSRELNKFEKKRIIEMYEKGYNKPLNSNIIIDNSKQAVMETACLIKSFLIRNKYI